MKLTTRQDIEAPLGFVYDQLCDFDGWERAAMRRGAEVERTDPAAAAGPGLAWRLRFRLRGRERKMLLRLVGMSSEGRLEFEMDSPSITGTSRIELMPLAARRTRMTSVLDIKPKTLAARLFLQSLKLARGKVQGRFDMRMGQLAAAIAERHQTRRI
jgi:hypothetical protein